MKQMSYVCDRCKTKAVGRFEHHFPHAPAGWTALIFGNGEYDLCPSCSEDIRLALKQLQLEMT